MDSTRETLDLAREKGLIRPRDLEARRISRQTLYRLEKRGDLVRVARGLYALPDADITTLRSVAEVAKTVPDGVICLLSALRFHKLTTQGPPAVWIAIENKSWRPARPPWPVEVVYMSGPSFETGVENHSVEGVEVKIFSAAKTVADSFKYRNRIGMDIAVESLRDYLKAYPDGANDLWHFGKICRVTRIIQPYLEALL